MSTKQSDYELLKSASELQREAKHIIEELEIFSTLRKISEPSVVGSVENGLMVWQDIDIHTYMKKLDINKVAGLLREFVLLPTIQKVQFSNFREMRRDHIKNRAAFPRAYYVGLRSIRPTGEWKIDIWFGEIGKPLNDYYMPDFSKIAKDQRIAILKLKKLWIDEKSGYKDGVISVDFYKAVLERGVKNADEFRAYLKQEM